VYATSETNEILRLEVLFISQVKTAPKMIAIPKNEFTKISMVNFA
jgi:hypothetical protein